MKANFQERDFMYKYVSKKVDGRGRPQGKIDPKQLAIPGLDGESLTPVEQRSLFDKSYNRFRP